MALEPGQGDRVELPLQMHDDDVEKLKHVVKHSRSRSGVGFAGRTKRMRWFIVAAAGVAAFVLGMWGYHRQFRLDPSRGGFLDEAYYTIKLFGFSVESSERGSGGVPLEIARWLAPLVAGVTAFGALLVLFRDRIRESMMSMFWRDHYVVCGLGEQGKTFVSALRNARRRVVVIERDAGSQNLSAAREAGAVVLVGDARQPEILDLAAVSRASLVLAVCGEDGINASIASALDGASTRAHSRRSPRCLIEMDNPDLALSLRAMEMRRAHSRTFTNAVSTRPKLAFRNVIESGVRELLQEHPPQPVGSSCHVLVVGSGDLAGRLVAHLLRRGRSDQQAVRRIVTVLTEDVDALVTGVGDTLPQEGAVELRCCAAPIDAASGALRDALSGPPPTMVYVCTGEDSSSLTAIVALRAGVISPAVPAVVVVSSSTGLAQLVKGSARERSVADVVFPLLERTCDLAVLEIDDVELIARARHAGYVREQAAKGETVSTNRSMMPWEGLGEDLRESNRDFARELGETLEQLRCVIVPIGKWQRSSVSFTVEETERLSMAEHDRFVAERHAQGWTFADGPKDETAKTSPTLVPWDDLPEIEREKDRAAIRDIEALLAEVGLQVMRLDAQRSP